MKKYELTNNTLRINHYGKEIILFQIKALRDISLMGVQAGDYGGWVQREANLSQEDESWIGEYGYVYDEAKVLEQAFVESGRVYDRSIIKGRSWIRDDSTVYGIVSCVIEGSSIIISSQIEDSHILGMTVIEKSDVKNLKMEDETGSLTVNLNHVSFEASLTGHVSANANWTRCRMNGKTLMFYENSTMSDIAFDTIRRVSVQQPFTMENARLEANSTLVLRPLGDKIYDIVIKGESDENYVLIDAKVSLSNVSIVGCVKITGRWTLETCVLSDFSTLIGTNKFRTSLRHGNLNEFSSIQIIDAKLSDKIDLGHLNLSAEEIYLLS